MQVLEFDPPASKPYRTVKHATAVRRLMKMVRDDHPRLHPVLETKLRGLLEMACHFDRLADFGGHPPGTLWSNYRQMLDSIERVLIEAMGEQSSTVTDLRQLLAAGG